MNSGGKQRSSPGAEEEPARKRARPSTDGGKLQDIQRVQLNLADCNLDFDIEDNGVQGHALHDKGFAYCWSGARANVGIRGGKYCFSCKVTAAQPVEMEDTPADQRHVCRVGISRGDDNVGNLGETEHSFGFGGTGKFSMGGKFSDYGSTFSVGDIILCAVNLESRPLAEISFCKNGAFLGVAKQFDSGPKGMGITDSQFKKLPWESALFPHVLLKNVVVKMQFSIEDGLVPLEGYKPWCEALQDGNSVNGPQFSSLKECEVVMMVGLPAAGKSTWAEKWAKDHPEKRYMVLGTNLALDQMKVPGLFRKHNYGERFERLMDRATGIFNTLLARAVKIHRNYILDQTNVYKTARKRKLRAFVGFCKIAVVIFPPPQELKIRAKKRFKEMGKEVPPEAVNEMLANYVLPTSKDMQGSDEFFDEVWFPELKREEAHKILETEKSELKATTITKSQNASPNFRSGSVASVNGPRASSVLSDRGAGSGGNWRSSSLHSMDHNIYNTPPKVGDVRGMPDMMRGTPDMAQGHGTEFGDLRGRFSVPSELSYGRYGGEVGNQRFSRLEDVRDQQYQGQRGPVDQPYQGQMAYRAQSYPDQSVYRDQPYPDQRGFRDQPYRDQGSLYSVNTGPQFGRPQSYSLPDLGRLQTRPPAPPGAGPYSMQPRPGWGHQPY
uniref:TSA: Wollemia nobilis Ref_Wollemi_Transcript_7737_2930 transcribed RNA sequence n=1 Tax=Wollemia nobilis TaxID=56998 RepID=A0A0C9QUZ4_9CONI